MMRLDFLFPRICRGCGKEWDYLCGECKKRLIPHPEICPFCHQKSSAFKTCLYCHENYPSLEGIIIGFEYDKLIQKLIFQVKFYHKKDVVDFLSDRLVLLFSSHEILQKEDKNLIAFSFIPSHRRRKYLEKGYNQSELLAKALARKVQLPCVQVAKKVKYTLSQLHFDKQGRQKNLHQAFKLFSLDTLAKNSILILVDDVTTTGATLVELSKLVKEVRPDIRIRGLVLARHNG